MYDATCSFCDSPRIYQETVDVGVGFVPVCPPECMGCGAIDCCQDLAGLTKEEVQLYLENCILDPAQLWPKYEKARLERGLRHDLNRARARQDWSAMRFRLLEVD